MQRIIVAAMHGEGEHLRTVAKNGSRAITLMHIEVDNEHFAAEPVQEQVFGGDGEVVEHTKAFATVGIGVVGATREVGSRTGMQGLPRCFEGAPHAAPRPQVKQRTLRKAQPPLLAGIEAARSQCIEVGGVVNSKQIGRVGFGGGNTLLRPDNPFMQELLPREVVFVHRETMAIWQGRGGGFTLVNRDHRL